MFGNRAPHMIDNDYTPHSAIDIFVKDLVCEFLIFLLHFFQVQSFWIVSCMGLFPFKGIVIGESSVLKIPLYVSAVAHQQFLSGSCFSLENLPWWIGIMHLLLVRKKLHKLMALMHIYNFFVSMRWGCGIEDLKRSTAKYFD